MLRFYPRCGYIQHGCISLRKSSQKQMTETSLKDMEVLYDKHREFKRTIQSFWPLGRFTLRTYYNLYICQWKDSCVFYNIHRQDEYETNKILLDFELRNSVIFRSENKGRDRVGIKPKLRTYCICKLSLFGKLCCRVYVT